MELTASVWCRAPHQLEWARRVTDGLQRNGVQIVEPNSHADFAITWGVRNSRAFAACPHVLVMERAYLGNRFEWLSLAWDGLNGRGKFFNSDVPDDRWLKYWRGDMREPSGGRGAMIIGQVVGDMATVGVDLNHWAVTVSKGLTKLGVEHCYRPHPEAIKRGQPQALLCDSRPLEQALEECDSVITYNSNVGVLAAMAGKRVTVENEGTMAYEVAGKGWKDDRELGDRDEWGRKLAYCQWLPDEVERGEFWQTLGRLFA